MARAVMADSEEDNKIIIGIHTEVVTLAMELQEVINKYLVKGDSEELLDANDRFLVASRAINIQAKRWFQHFHDEFNAEKSIEKLKAKRAIL